MKTIKGLVYGLPFLAVGAIILSGISVVEAASSTTVPLPNGISIATGTLQSTGAVTGLLCGTLNWIFWGLIVLAVVMFLVGGYKYATSGGDPEKTRGATKTLTYAAIAIVVALIAAGVPYVVSTFLNNGTNGFGSATFC